MTTYFAFIRGINVGGNATLPMKELTELCREIGYKEVRTYINSGNVIFKSALAAEKLQEKLEKALIKKMGRDVQVIVRDIKSLEKVLANNPYPKCNPSKVGVMLTKDSVDKKLIKDFSGVGTEEIETGKQEVYVHYPDGMGTTKLKWPASLKNGTMRNINTITKLIYLANKK